MKTKHNLLGASLLGSQLLASAPAPAASLTSTPFGRLADGRAVTRYTLTARNGVRVRFISYGGIITDVTAPDRQGRPGHLVLGFATLREYETKNAQGELYFGALLGRYTGSHKSWNRSYQ